MEHSSGRQACLYLVATPIGNLEDITLRALRILKEVDQIACEDTRHTQKLLSHYNIRKPLVSYHEHNGERRRALERLRIEDRTIIFYEAPHRIEETLIDAHEILGDRPACIAREVTKLHEEFRRGSLAELAASLAEKPARGEITLLIGPVPAEEKSALRDTSQSLADRVDELIRQAKLDRKEALKLAAKERGLSKRAAYQELHLESEDSGGG